LTKKLYAGNKGKDKVTHVYAIMACSGSIHFQSLFNFDCRWKEVLNFRPDYCTPVKNTSSDITVGWVGPIAVLTL
jgi:hypothetical protein